MLFFFEKNPKFNRTHIDEFYEFCNDLIIKNPLFCVKNPFLTFSSARRPLRARRAPLQIMHKMAFFSFFSPFSMFASKFRARERARAPLVRAKKFLWVSRYFLII